MQSKLGFSQRHPFVFGFLILMAAMFLLVGSMAVFGYLFFGKSDTSKFSSKKSFGVVNVSGVIFESEDYNDWIKKLEEDDKILGVILRVDSPGGGVSASQEIHRAVKKLAAKKPVVASMGTVAASGGYYVACPAHTILANPGTITGSIGVRMELTNLMGLMDMLGVSHQSFTSGKLKDAGSPYRELTAEERAYFQGLVADLFDQFVTDVAEARKLPQDKVRQIADGRVLSGRQAQVEGLVDGMGGMDEATSLLKKLCKVDEDKDPPLVHGPPEDKSFWKDILTSLVRMRLDTAQRLSLPQYIAPF